MYLMHIRDSHKSNVLSLLFSVNFIFCTELVHIVFLHGLAWFWESAQNTTEPITGCPILSKHKNSPNVVPNLFKVCPNE